MGLKIVNGNRRIMDTPLLVVPSVEDSLTRVELIGRLGSSLPAEVRNEVLSLVKPGCQMVLDLSRLRTVSGQGLRMLLLLCRQVSAVGGTLLADGATDELRDLAQCAGFGDLFRGSLGERTSFCLSPFRGGSRSIPIQLTALPDTRCE